MWVRRGMHKGVEWERNEKKRDHLGDLDISKRIILKWI
jgi:hypothetical protein